MQRDAMDPLTFGQGFVASLAIGALFQVWRRTGNILDELRLQRAEQAKGAPLTEAEREHIEVRTDAWNYQPPDKKA